MSDPEPSPRRGRPKTFDRAHVLDVATGCWWREGPDGISLNAICREAGVSKPGVYREFGNEDGLMAASLEHYATTVLQPVLAVTQDPDVPFARALAHMLDHLTTTDARRPAGCLFTRLRSAAGRLGPKTQAGVEAMRAKAFAAYTTWVERAKGAGEVSTDVPTDLCVHFIDGQLTHLLSQMAAGDDPALLRAQVWLAFRGLGVTPPGE